MFPPQPIMHILDAPAVVCTFVVWGNQGDQGPLADAAAQLQTQW